VKHAIVAATILLAGCLGPAYQTPKVDVPETFTVASAEPFRDDWWSLFGDAQLEQLIREASTNNLDLRVAEARIREARAMRGITASRGKPEVDAAASVIAARRGDLDRTIYDAGFDASWELDLFGGIRRDVEAAIAQVQAVEEQRRDVGVTLAAEVARNYVELRGAQARLDLLDARLKILNDVRDLTRERRRAGLVTELDVVRIDAFIDDTAASRASLEHIANASMQRLRVLTGGKTIPLTNGPIPHAPRELPVGVPGELLARRPDVRVAERQLAAATARIDVARAQLYPRISLTGAAGRRSDEPYDPARSVSNYLAFGPALRWPILSGGRIRNDIEAQKARRDAAAAQFQHAVLRALEDVETSLSAVHRDRDEREKLESAVASEKLATSLAGERYRAGLDNFLIVLDAERSLREREDRLARTETSLALSTISLYKALGGGF